HNLALAYALNNSTDSALSVIKRTITYNANYPFEKEHAFQALKKSNHYSELIQLSDSLNSNFSSSEVEVIATKNTLHAEDIAVINNRVFISDVHRGQLIQIESDGEISVLANLSSSLMALVVDHQNNLWITTSMIPQYNEYDSTRESQTFIYQYDIKGGNIKEKIPLEGQHVLGAGCIDQSGNVYFTDSQKPIIYKLNTSNNIIEVFMPLDDAFNLQGITYHESDNSLYVADYIKGIAKISLEDNTIHWLIPEEFLLKGIDGLSSVQNGLIAIQNGSAQKRLLFVMIDDEGVAQVDIVDNNLNYAGEPTNGKVIEGKYYYIANSPWPLYEKDGKANPNNWEALEIRSWKVR
ncbi:MAG: hypothetical protein AAFN93_06985, partial [Bacteroidota bacterium]